MKFGVNPFMMGLLGGMQGFVGGYGQYQQQQNLMAMQNQKFGMQMSLAKLRAQNDMLIKSLALEANQRAFNVNKIGPDGKPYTYQMRNVYDPNSQSFSPQQIGDPVPYKDPLAANTATNATRLQVANMEIAAANARKTSNQTKNAALQNELDARQNLREIGLSKRSAMVATNQSMREFDKDDPDTQAQMLQPYGIDPTDKAARSKYRQAVYQENLQVLGVDGQSGGAAPAASDQGQPNLTPDGRQIKYGPDGTPYVLGPNGTPIPYFPTSDTGTGDASQGLAMDQTVASPEYANAGDDSDDGQDDENVAGSGNAGLLQDQAQDDSGDDAQDD